MTDGVGRNSFLIDFIRTRAERNWLALKREIQEVGKYGQYGMFFGRQDSEHPRDRTSR